MLFWVGWGRRRYVKMNICSRPLLGRMYVLYTPSLTPTALLNQRLTSFPFIYDVMRHSKNLGDINGVETGGKTTFQHREICFFSSIMTPTNLLLKGHLDYVDHLSLRRFASPP